MDLVFDQNAAQLIAQNVSEALKEKNVTLDFHVNCSDRFNSSRETSCFEFLIDSMNCLFFGEIFNKISVRISCVFIFIT